MFVLEFASESLHSSLSWQSPDRLFRTCCRHFLAVPVGTPNASVLSELRLDDSSRITVKLGPRLVAALDSETRTPVLASIFRLATHVPGTCLGPSLVLAPRTLAPAHYEVGPLAQWHLVALGNRGFVLGLSAFHTVRFACSTSL